MEGSPTPKPVSPPANLWFTMRVLVKALLLFVGLNLAYALLDPLPVLARLSIYGSLVPGRQRLPFGEVPEQAYNLSLYSLEAMFASHIVTTPKAADEYRVILIGDSSVWGFLLTPEQTLAGQINAADYELPDGRSVRAYNLGYPTITLTKDLLILSRAVQFEPDLIVWLTTLESFPYHKQLSSPIVQNNPAPVRALITYYGLNLDSADSAFRVPTFWDRTIIGQRRALADVFRLNLYGVMWAATGVDQVYPETYTPRQEDFEVDDSFYDFRPPLSENALAFDVLAAGVSLAGDVPVLVVNEPIFVSSGKNSDIRYNFFYPRWAYDDYRRLLADQAAQRGWWYLDLWDAVPPTEYTNSAIHLTPAGTAQLANRIVSAILNRP